MKPYFFWFLTLVLLAGLTACGQAAAISPTATAIPVVDAPQPAAAVPTATFTIVPTDAPQSTEPPQPTARPTRTITPTPEANESAHWQIVNQVKIDHDFNLLGFLNPSLGITVGYAGQVRYSTDNALTWPKANNESYCRFGLEIVNEKVAWTCGNAGHIRLSTDGGQTWQAATGFGGSEPAQCRHLSFLDATTGWAATPTELGATADGAQTWQTVALPQGIGEIEAIFLRTAADGYIFDSLGKLYVTADSGQTWKRLSLPENHQSLKIVTQRVPSAAVRFSDAEHGVVVYQTQDFATGWHAWAAYTTDGGKGWQVEHLPSNPRMVSPTYMSRDGQFLTLTATKTNIEAALFQYKP